MYKDIGLFSQRQQTKNTMKPTQITHCEIPIVFRPLALVRAVTRTSIIPSKAQLTKKVIPVMVQNGGFTFLKTPNALNITGFT